jgi:hypothetical protein
MPGRMARVMLSMAGYPAHGPARVVATARTLTRLPGELKRMMHAHCDVAALHAKHLGLPADVIALFPSIYERWDGKGGPARVRGEAIPRAVRIAQVARDLDIQRSMARRPRPRTSSGRERGTPSIRTSSRSPWTSIRFRRRTPPGT